MEDSHDPPTFLSNLYRSFVFRGLNLTHCVCSIVVSFGLQYDALIL